MRDKFDPIIFKCFSHEQVKVINTKIKEYGLQKQDPSKVAFGVSKKGDFFNIPCMPLMELLHPWLYQCQQVNREFFGYNIYWNFHLDMLNYNEYGIGSEYDWHIDATSIASDVKLTCLLNLSEEPYGGGNFYEITSREEKEYVSGEGLLLTSLIAHKVTPVTKGKRITLTYWAMGPKWN